MKDQPTGETLARIRTLCHELASRHNLSDDARDELCAHLEEKLTGYLTGDVKVNEEDALILVRAHFGDPDPIARQLGRGRVSGTEQFLSRSVNHARLYSALLVILGISTAFSIPTGLVVWGLRQLGGTALAHTRIPAWAIPWSAAICAVYLVAIIVTLTARRLRPDAGRRFTRALNYALLAAPPFGTLLGIYGLLALDRDNRSAVAT